MFITAIILLTIWGAIIGITLLISKLFELKIARTPVARKAVRYRMVFNVIRIFIIILFIGIVILFFYIMSDILASMSDNAGKLTIIGMIGLIITTFATLSLPIHSYTKEDVKEKDFVLYLRGFMTDKYEFSSTENSVISFFNLQNILALGTTKKEPRSEDMPFSEEKLAKACGKAMPVYCVGQPGEVYCPRGCKRVYLDHATWKEDVADMIIKAKYVVILLHNTENCIWEILKCNATALQKTIFLVEDIYSYNKIAESMQGTLPEVLSSPHQQLLDEFDKLMNDLVPDMKQKLEDFSNALDKSKNIPEELKQEMFLIYTQREIKLHCAIYQKNGKAVVTRYRNTIGGIRMVLDDMSK